MNQKLLTIIIDKTAGKLNEIEIADLYSKIASILSERLSKVPPVLQEPVVLQEDDEIRIKGYTLTVLTVDGNMIEFSRTPSYNDSGSYATFDISLLGNLVKIGEVEGHSIYRGENIPKGGGRSQSPPIWTDES